MPKTTISPELPLVPKGPGRASDKKLSQGTIVLNKKARKPRLSGEDSTSRLEKYEILDRNHPLNKPFTGSPSFRGPVFKRKYTNLICIFLFIIANVGFLLLGVIAWKDGASGRLMRGMDFRSEICGLGKLKDKPYLYFASPSIDLNVKFCVEECPSTSGQQICLYDVNPTKATPFCYTQSQTSTAGRFCIPVEPINRKVVDDDLSKLPNISKRIAGDLLTSWEIMTLGLVISLLMAALFLRIMYDPQKIKYVIWGSVCGTVIACIIMAAFFYREYLETIDDRCIQKIDKRGCGGFKATLFKYACYGFLVIDVLYMALVIKIFNRINLGVGVLKHTAKCSTIFQQIKALPWILSIILLFVSIYVVVGTIMGFSVGEIIVIEAKNIDGGYVKTIEYSSKMRYSIAYNFFMLQWWQNVVLLFVDAVLSYALSIWYFEKRKETVVLPTNRVTKDVLKYHIGTIIMLSLYKILFRPVRMVMGMLTSLMRKPKQHRNIVRFMQACCFTCIHLHERSLRYQSKHAIVQMVMWSESFRVASKRAWFLLFRHKLRIRNLDGLTTFILFLTKMVCALFGGLFVYVYISIIPRTILGTKTSDIETPLAPTVLVFYIGFFFASVFQSSLDIATKTLLQCYLMDAEMFTGEQRFAAKNVLELMELFKGDLEEEGKFAKITQYVQGIKTTLDPTVPQYKEEDPDDEENKKFDPKVRKKDDDEEESEEEEEEDEQTKAKADKNNFGGDSGSEEESEEDEDDSEEESEEDQPAFFKKNIFGGPAGDNEDHSQQQLFKKDLFASGADSATNFFKKDIFGDDGDSNHGDHLGTTGNDFGKSIPSVTSIQSTPLHVKQNPSSSKGNLSFFGREQEKSMEFQQKKIEKAEDSEEDEDEDEDEEEEESEEEKEDHNANQASIMKAAWNPNESNDATKTIMFKDKSIRDVGVKANRNWKPLEMSALSNSIGSQRGLLRKGGEDTADLHLKNASEVSITVNNTKIINNNTNNTMRGDSHNIFNKSKIANNSTMKLDYDDDEEANMKYRL